MPHGKKYGGRTKGTPNKATADVKDLARKWGPEAILKLAQLAGLREGEGLPPAESEPARVSALGMLLDRAYGKPTQVVAGDPESPLQAVQEVRVTFVNPKPKG